MKKLFALMFVAVAGIGTAFSQTALSTTEVDWANTAATLLLNGNGVALTQGSALNNDGDLIQLGFFSSGTAGNNFTGTWIPLTGAGGQNTSIGDSPDLSGLGNGRIGFNTTFHFSLNQVDVYDSTADSGHYITQSSITIGAQPAAGQVLAIRFYDTTNASGHYNTVSSNTWTWVTPTDAGSFVSNINLATSTLTWESVSVFGLNGTEFRTVLPIPEPSTVALIVAGAVGFLALRRRTKS